MQEYEAKFAGAAGEDSETLNARRYALQTKRPSLLHNAQQAAVDELLYGHDLDPTTSPSLVRRAGLGWGAGRPHRSGQPCSCSSGQGPYLANQRCAAAGV